MIAVWQLARPATGFLQRDPLDGAPATAASEVRVLYDDDALYFGCRYFDPEPAKITARLARRDDEEDTDRGSVRIDTFHDHQNAYELTFNPAGVRVDILQYRDGAVRGQLVGSRLAGGDHGSIRSAGPRSCVFRSVSSVIPTSLTGSNRPGGSISSGRCFAPRKKPAGRGRPSRCRDSSPGSVISKVWSTFRSPAASRSCRSDSCARNGGRRMGRPVDRVPRQRRT